ncbi:MAG: 30S ribosomal protein S4 [Proteobacteria bacterium]|jgi:small subunit ribosomal protein S4|nr:30S ribosomal protein S4 [Pseudomonadota bacterium]
MSKIIHSKSKISRKYGVNLWGKANDAFNKKPYVPGQHGGKVMRIAKTYRKQLVEKNKMRFFHILTERQFSNLVRASIKSRHNSTEMVLQNLNSLLSTVLFSSGLFATIFFAKQLISHGHVLVNGRRVSSHTYKVKVGDIITFVDKLKANTQVRSYIDANTPVFPSYLKVTKETMTIELTALPDSTSVKYPCEMQPSVVIEYYSA